MRKSRRTYPDSLLHSLRRQRHPDDLNIVSDDNRPVGIRRRAPDDVAAKGDVGWLE